VCRFKPCQIKILQQFKSRATVQRTANGYLRSLTFKAPKESFNDLLQEFFGGKSPDDLFWPMHLNFAFFGMEQLPTFACFDVMKNPQIERDLERYRSQLKGFSLLNSGRATTNLKSSNPLASQQSQSIVQ